MTGQCCHLHLVAELPELPARCHVGDPCSQWLLNGQCCQIILSLAMS